MEEKASATYIDVLIVIDTEYVKRNYPKPSQDQNAPTGINHNSQFMIVTGSRGKVSGQGTADLHFEANPRDTVAFRGTSIYANSDDAVIVYGIKHHKGDKVLGRFRMDQTVRNRAVQPDADSENGLPPIHRKVNFNNLNAAVQRSGKEWYYVNFALYTLENDGQTQSLFGYYYWDPSISVNP